MRPLFVISKTICCKLCYSKLSMVVFSVQAKRLPYTPNFLNQIKSENAKTEHFYSAKNAEISSVARVIHIKIIPKKVSYHPSARSIY